MKVQIVDDNGKVLHIPSENRHLEADLRILLAGIPGADAIIDQVCAELRNATARV